MTFGAADPSSLLSYATTNWPLHPPTETGGAEDTPAPTGDPGSCPATRAPQNRAISAPVLNRGSGRSRAEDQRARASSSLVERTPGSFVVTGDHSAIVGSAYP